MYFLEERIYAEILDFSSRSNERTGSQNRFYNTTQQKVSIATSYGLGDRGVGVRVPVRSRIFSTSSRPAVVSIQPPIQWVPGVKQPGREPDHSPPVSADVKKMWIYTSTPPYSFMA
jgi:hypothetical protein